MIGFTDVAEITDYGRYELVTAHMLRDIVDAKGNVLAKKGDTIEMTRIFVEDKLIPFGFCEIITP